MNYVINSRKIGLTQEKKLRKTYNFRDTYIVSRGPTFGHVVLVNRSPTFRPREAVLTRHPTFGFWVTVAYHSPISRFV